MSPFAAMLYFALVCVGLFVAFATIIWLESDVGPSKPELRHRRKK